MPNNSLLIMGGDMQLHYKHSVPKLNRRELKLCATCADIRHLDGGVMSIWYFTIALMNHNTDPTFQDTDSAKDWGEYQLRVCSDIGTGLSFWGVGSLYLA
eukprot:g29479.t1